MRHLETSDFKLRKILQFSRFSFIFHSLTLSGNPAALALIPFLKLGRFMELM